MKHLIALAALLACACGESEPLSSPSPIPPTPPAPTLYTVTGIVTSATGGGISNAIVLIADGPNAGLSTMTDGAGRYTLNRLTFAGFSIVVTAAGYVTTSRGVPLTAETTTADFVLLPSDPWTQSGTGNAVFEMPTYLTRVRIIGVYNGNSSSLVIRVAGQLLVNELLGTFWGMTQYDRVHLTSGGTVEITNSTGVAWSFTEQR